MANPQHEPTMEEILASIRKIISDDAAPMAPVAAPPGHGTAEPEVLELTHEVDAQPEAEAICAPIHDLRSEEPHPMPPTEAPAETAAEPVAPPQPEDGIFSEKARKALSEALAGIAPPDVVVQAHVAASATAGGTVEAVFERALKDAFDPVLQKWLDENSEALVERMKPAIRDWLDENFPTLLEEAIRGEVARAAAPRRRR